MTLRSWQKVIVIGILCLLASMSLAAAPKKYQVTILADNFSGYKSNIAKSIEVSALSEDANINSSTLENWDPQAESNLYIALGVEALQALSKQQTKQPVLAGLITSSQWQSFSQEFPQNNFNAIFYDPDPAKQILLANMIKPTLSNMGILYSHQYFIDTERVNKIATSVQLKVNFNRNQNNENFYREYAEISSKNDALLFIPDKVNYNRDSIPKAILTSYRQNKFIIGYSKAIVKSGALATTYTSSKDYIDDLIESSMKMLNDTKVGFRRFSNTYSIATNNKVAKSMGLVIPPAAQLKSSINKAMKQLESDNLN